MPAAFGVAAAYAVSATAALFLFCRDGANDYKCAWLAVIAALPVVGAILYAFSCTGAEKRADNAVGLPLSTYRDCEYFKDGSNYLERLRECVASAQKTVFLEYYIISKGHIWGLMYKELEKALARGVSVKIIYDGWGSALHAPKRDFKRLTKRGAEIKVFNKLLPFPVSRLNFRNHRKIAAIDKQTVFLGGVNIADEYANISSPHGYWKDGGVMLCGDIAEEYNEVFLSDFYGENRLPKVNKAKSGGERVLAVVDSPRTKYGRCEDLVTAKIYSANTRVCIFTPYLCMGEKLKDALIYAAGRGVAIEIIVPQIPDKRITYEITLSFAAELAEHAIKVYRYTPGFMHAKGVICDDEVLLGSYNFDYRSMRLNYECGVWTGGELARCAYEDFKQSLTASTQINGRAVSLPRKVLRGALKLFAPLA